jgi:hypothetical protein
MYTQIGTPAIISLHQKASFGKILLASITQVTQVHAEDSNDFHVLAEDSNDFHVPNGDSSQMAPFGWARFAEKVTRPVLKSRAATGEHPCRPKRCQHLNVSSWSAVASESPQPPDVSFAVEACQRRSGRLGGYDHRRMFGAIASGLAVRSVKPGLGSCSSLSTND